eukprot:Anaeramoba_ignava/c21137_g2_i2.p1 GENE.c21137_g2_i2~~c21137_g2_i2.p1  ORF type:complete len:503 (+),score=178.10 c21137_g2_i2:184-1692(+)
MGTPYLTKILNNRLVNHIQKCLPEISRSIETELSKAQAELENMGSDEGDLQRKQIAFKSLSRFAQEFKDLIDGTDSETDYVDSDYAKKVLGGAKIRYHCTVTLKKGIQNLRLGDDLKDAIIYRYIQNAEGAITRLGIPENAFQWAIRTGLSKLFEPCLACAKNVEQELIETVITTANKIKEFGSFPILRDRILEISQELIHNFLKPTQDLITKLINMELSFINFDHPLLQLKKFTEEKTQGLIEGWLTKISPKKKTRWFVLKGKTLFIYASPNESHAMDVVPLEGCFVESFQDIENFQKQNPEKKDDDEDEDLEAVEKPKFVPNGPTLVKERRKSIFGRKKQTELLIKEQELYFRIRHPFIKHLLKKEEILEFIAEDVETFEKWFNPIKKAAQGSEKGLKSRTNRDIWLVREVANSYFRTVTITLSDTVPKAIMFEMVNPTKQKLEGSLMARIYDEELLDDIMNEDPAIKEKRQRLKRTILLLQEAKEILSNVSSIKIQTKI